MTLSRLKTFSTFAGLDFLLLVIPQDFFRFQEPIQTLVYCAAVCYLYVTKWMRTLKGQINGSLPKTLSTEYSDKKQTNWQRSTVSNMWRQVVTVTLTVRMSWRCRHQWCSEHRPAPPAVAQTLPAVCSAPHTVLGLGSADRLLASWYTHTQSFVLDLLLASWYTHTQSFVLDLLLASWYTHTQSLVLDLLASWYTHTQSLVLDLLLASWYTHTQSLVSNLPLAS